MILTWPTKKWSKAFWAESENCVSRSLPPVLVLQKVPPDIASFINNHVSFRCLLRKNEIWHVVADEFCMAIFDDFQRACASELEIVKNCNKWIMNYEHERALNKYNGLACAALLSSARRRHHSPSLRQTNRRVSFKWLPPRQAGCHLRNIRQPAPLPDQQATGTTDSRPVR